MLEQIKTTLFPHYDSEEQKGLCITARNNQKKQLRSHGVIMTDKPMRILVEELYEEHVKPDLKNLTYLTIDTITDITQVQQADEIFSKNPKEYGFLLIDLEDDKSWSILPNTAGITTAKDAIFQIKQTHSLHGNVTVYVFRTERITMMK
jgi:hypothetical protein